MGSGIVEQKKQEEQRQELEKVKQRRLEREREREERESALELEERQRENDKFSKWRKDEDEFHLQQARLRSKIRIDDGRAKPIDLLAKFNTDVVTPISEMSGEYLLDHYPRLSKILRWKFRKRLGKIYNIYLSGVVNGSSFKKFKEYHLLVYEKGENY